MSEYGKILKDFEVAKRRFAQRAFSRLFDNCEKKHGDLRRTAKTVASDFGVTVKSLLHWHERQRNLKKKLHHRRLLNNREESGLVNHICRLSMAHRPLTRTDIINKVRSDKKLGKEWNGSSWYRGFRERHQNELEERTANSIESKRVSPELVTQVKAFVKCWADHRSKFSEANGDCLINCDESLMNFHVVDKNTRYLVAKGTKVQKIINDRDTTTIGMLTFVTASGKALFNLKVFPKTKKQLERMEKSEKFKVQQTGRRDKSKVMFTAISYSESGWVTKEIWKRTVTEFCQVTKKNFHGRHSVLFMDRLSAHKDKESLDLLHKHGIHGVFFPAKTSHFLQPLDQQIFALIKKALRKEIMEILAKNNNQKLTKREQLTALSTAIDNNLISGLKPHVVIGAWKKAGLYPWQPTRIEEVLEINTGVGKEKYQHLLKKAERSKLIYHVHQFKSNNSLNSVKDRKTTW